MNFVKIAYDTKVWHIVGHDGTTLCGYWPWYTWPIVWKGPSVMPPIICKRCSRASIDRL